MNLTAIEAKNRSYSVADSLTRGDRVVIGQADHFHGPIPAGTVGVLEDLSNAGFRGIEAHVRLTDDRRVTVSAGILVPAWAW